MKKKIHTLVYIKRQAKKIKKLQGITHTQALELISKQHGYSNWKHYCKVLNQQTIPEIQMIKEQLQLSFTEWLKKHRKRNSPLGDLASDMIRDKTWPLDNTLHTYESHLSFKNASSDAMQVLKRAWRTYGAFLKKKNAPLSNNINQAKRVLKNHDPRKIVLINNVTPLHFLKRTAEKFNPTDKAWISWDGRKAIPVTILKVEDRHYTFRVERPLKDAGSEHYLFLDEVRSSPELACANFVTS